MTLPWPSDSCFGGMGEDRAGTGRNSRGFELEFVRKVRDLVGNWNCWRVWGHGQQMGESKLQVWFRGSFLMNECLGEAKGGTILNIARVSVCGERCHRSLGTSSGVAFVWEAIGPRKLLEGRFQRNKNPTA